MPRYSFALGSLLTLALGACGDAVPAAPATPAGGGGAGAAPTGGGGVGSGSGGGGGGGAGGSLSGNGGSLVLVVGGGMTGGEAGSLPAEPCNSEPKLLAVVRDFRGYEVSDTEPRHPDFEGQFFGFKGIVSTQLGADRTPTYAATGSTPATTGSAEFAQWYHDTPGVNERFEIELPLTADPAREGMFIYDNQEFFPIDGRGFDDGFSAHNFHFTTEIHVEFTYLGGESFTFRGDDDVWVFINEQLVIDLGGVHPADGGSVDLDAQATALGLERGAKQRMDIFQAERHTDYSTFRIETSLRCLKNVVVVK